MYKVPKAVKIFTKVLVSPLVAASLAVVSIVLAVRDTSLVPLSFMTVENINKFSDRIEEETTRIIENS